MITSTIIWNENISEAPEEENLLIWVSKDIWDGDYSTVGWKVPYSDIWFVNGTYLYSKEIKMWAFLPKY